MDKLTREAMDHEKISETLAFFENSLHLLPPERTKKWAREFTDFLDEFIIGHFEFEETALFPFIRINGTEEEKSFIRELEEEHIKILDIVEKYKNLISHHKSTFSEQEISRFIESSKPMIRKILEHALKEDEKFFPVLEKYKVDLNKF